MLRFLSVTVCLLSSASLSAGGLEPIATTCVTNSTELQAALDAAETNGANDTIRIAIGKYDAPAGGFVYDAVAAANGDDLTVSITGGWIFSGNPCGQQLAQDPSLTILDGNYNNRVLKIRVWPNSAVHVELLTLIHGSAGVHGRGGGLELTSYSSYSSRMTVERNAFVDNTADFGGGLSAFNSAVDSGRLYVVNNLFVQNHAHSDIGAAALGLNDGHIHVTNNTAVANTSASPLPNGGIDIDSTGEFFVANNNLHGNEGSDLDLGAAPVVTLTHNNIGVRTGFPPNVEYGNISVEPEYEGGMSSYTPIYYSPLVNSGTEPAPFCIPPSCWFLGATDAAGNPRVVGPRVDIGAYESQEAELIFVNGFDPPT